jgi:hypothetical protein
MVDSGPARRFSPVAESCRGSAGLHAMENHLSISSRDVPLQNISHVIFLLDGDCSLSFHAYGSNPFSNQHDSFLLFFSMKSIPSILL